MPRFGHQGTPAAGAVRWWRARGRAQIILGWYDSPVPQRWIHPVHGRRGQLLHRYLSTVLLVLAHLNCRRRTRIRTFGLEFPSYTEIGSRDLSLTLCNVKCSEKYNVDVWFGILIRVSIRIRDRNVNEPFNFKGLFTRTFKTTSPLTQYWTLRPRLHCTPASMLRQCGNDASDTAPF